MKWSILTISTAILLLTFISISSAQELNLSYFLSKAASNDSELTKQERSDLLDHLERMMDQSETVLGRLTQVIQSGELDVRYQEGKLWLSRIEEDRESIKTGIQHLKALRDKPMVLVMSIRLFKLLKDLSDNLNAYNNMPIFSSIVGDLAPEIGLWTDPVFYKLHLLSLAQLKDKEVKPPPPKEVPKVPPKDKPTTTKKKP